jgi:hypothetical protein
MEGRPLQLLSAMRCCATRDTNEFFLFKFMQISAHYCLFATSAAPGGQIDGRCRAPRTRPTMSLFPAALVCIWQPARVRCSPRDPLRWCPAGVPC